MQIVDVGGGRKLSKRPGTPVLREAQKHILSRLEKKWVPGYIETPQYKARMGDVPDGASQHSSDSVSHVSGRGLIICLSQSSSPEYSESHEVLLLKKCLYDRHQRNMFKRFIAVQAAEKTCPGNNIDLWLEIQRYKV